MDRSTPVTAEHLAAWTPPPEDLADHDAPPGVIDPERFDHDDRVRHEAARLRARLEAQDLVQAERTAADPVPAFDAGFLDDVLARPEEPAHRVEGLIPSQAGTLIVGQRKLGKSTFILNLARTLIEGGDFLGRFSVRPIAGRIAILNYEVSAAQLARWARDVGIPGDRLFLVNLRGRRNPLSHPRDRAMLADRLAEHQVESLIVDPFGRAYTGTSQNDPGEVGSWLSDLDRFGRGEVRAVDIILATHAGWNGERTRGSTALEDWADSIITLTRNDDGERFLRAEGRDVHIDEDQLLYDTDSRTLSLAGTGSRKATAQTRKHEAQIPVVLELLAAHPTMSGNALDVELAKTDLPHSKGDGARVAQLLERRAMVGSKEGPRRARLFFLITSPSSLRLPPGDSATSPTSLTREGSPEGNQEDNTTRGTHQEIAP